MRRAESDAVGVNKVEVLSEEEADRGWRSRVRLDWADGGTSEHDVTLSWADHDHLSGGTLRPEQTVRRALAIAADAIGRSALPARFDLSTLRRLVPGLDERFFGTDDS